MGSPHPRLRIISTRPLARRRIVLNNKILPVRHPDGTVRTDFRIDRRHPFIRARQHIKSIPGHITRSFRLDIHQPDQFHRRLADHRLALQPRRQAARLDKHVPSRRRIAAHDVDLSVVRRDRMSPILNIDLFSCHHLQVFRHYRGRDPTKEAWRIVGRAPEQITRRIVSKSPGVVAELVQELELTAIRLQPVHPLAKSRLLTALHFPSITTVPHRAVHQVVVPVMQLGGLRMGVANAPARMNLLPYVRLAVTIRIFQKKEPRRLGNNDPTPHQNQPGRNI